jgi:hypothetical protein
MERRFLKPPSNNTHLLIIELADIMVSQETRSPLSLLHPIRDIESLLLSKGEMFGDFLNFAGVVFNLVTSNQ